MDEKDDELQNNFGATKFSIWELIPLGAAGRCWALLGAAGRC